MPCARFGVLAGTVDHKKIGVHHSGRALCGHITLVIGRKIDLCLPDPEIVHIVSMLGSGKVKQGQVHHLVGLVIWEGDLPERSMLESTFLRSLHRSALASRAGRQIAEAHV